MVHAGRELNRLGLGLVHTPGVHPRFPELAKASQRLHDLGCVAPGEIAGRQRGYLLGEPLVGLLCGDELLENLAAVRLQ